MAWRLPWRRVTPDEVVLRLQQAVDSLAASDAAPPRRRRLLVVQVDGLARSVLLQALAEGRMPFLQRLLSRHGFRLHATRAGLPTSTPAFQMATLYGVRPDVPGFHYHDKRRGTDVWFPRAGDAAYQERAQAGGRRGILQGGSAYGCVFTGGAGNNLFTASMLKRPSGGSVRKVVSGFVLLGWVLLKGVARSLVEVGRALRRALGGQRDWKWVAIKVGMSFFIHEFFTLAVARDLAAGAPAVYVNFLEYDVLAHAYGPGSRRAVRSLRHVDRSLRRFWGVMERHPEYGYDAYILSDHGQVGVTPYGAIAGRPLERLLFDEFFDRTHEVAPLVPPARGLATTFRTYRAHGSPGLFQRFLSSLQEDFPWRLGALPETGERDGVRVISAGPNAFVYLLDSVEPVPLEEIDERFPALVDRMSLGPGIGFLLARSHEGPVCIWRGRRFRLQHGEAGPFAGRPDLPLLLQELADLTAMPSAGDLILYGHGSPQGDVSYIDEVGAHAGPSPEELQTFLIAPPGVRMPEPITHPIQLYPHFLSYQPAPPETDHAYTILRTAEPRERSLA
jgi:hypothetical protein